MFSICTPQSTANAEAAPKLEALLRKHNVRAIAIGNGNRIP